MLKIMFLNNWGDSSETMLERYRFQTPNHDGVWGEIQAVTNKNEADYFVIMDGYNKFTELPASKRVYFQREPKVIVKNHAFFGDNNAAFKGSYDKHHHLATWQIRKPFNELQELQVPEKPKLISTVTSNKRITEGQRKRLNLVQNVQKKCPEMDFYGRGFKPLNYNKYCKFNGLIDYKYSIACENCSIPNYFTEKFIDCLLCWTKPIYWGCSNIEEYFPKGSYVLVDIDNPNATSYILEEIQKPVDYDILKEARDLVLNKYNVWPAVERVLKGIRNE